MTVDPITSAHLLAALAWAEGACTPAQLAGRSYNQEEWDCGTACCIHGAAHLLARGEPATHRPDLEDYADLPPPIRDGVVSVLKSPGGTPALVRRVLSGAIQIGADVVIGPEVQIDDGASIDDRVHLRSGSVVGASSVVGAGSFICTGTVIGAGAVVESDAIVGARALIKDRARVGPGVVVVADAVVPAGAGVKR